MRFPLFQKIQDTCRRVWTTPRLRGQLFTGIILVLSAVLLFKGLKQGGALDDDRLNDFEAYHAGARAVLKGDLVPAYSSAPRPYMYPPTLAVLIAPLGAVSRSAVVPIWTAASLAFLLWAYRRARRALGPEIQELDLFMGFLLTFRVYESDFSNGNVNTIVISIIILGFARARSGREASGGGLLGLAAALKVTPLLLLLWMVVQRRWRMARGFVAGLILAGVLLPLVVLGPVQYGRALGAFYSVTLRPLDVTSPGYHEEAPGGYLPGQSLRALLHRLLRPIDATAHDRDATVTVNFAHLGKEEVDLLYVISAILILVLLLRRFRSRGGPWRACEIGAAVAAMVLLSPLSRKAHFVAIFPAAAMGFSVQRMATGRFRRPARLLWWGALALVALSTPALLGKSLSSYLLSFCPLSLAVSGLIILCAAGQGSGGNRENRREEK